MAGHKGRVRRPNQKPRREHKKRVTKHSIQSSCPSPKNSSSSDNDSEDKCIFIDDDDDDDGDVGELY